MQQLELRIREAEERDAAAIADALNEHSRALFAETDLNDAEVREWFRLKDIWIRVAEREGRIVGYVDVAKNEGRPRWDVDARTLYPEVADELLAAAEEYVRVRSSAADALRGYAGSDDTVLASAYERAGYRVIRHSFQMRIDLPDELEEPTWPEGITVRNYRPEDELRVYEAATEAFEDHWESHPHPLDEWRRYNVERENFDPSLWWLAEDGDEIAGVSENWWHVSGDKTFGWIGTLGVRRPWRRRGLGRALLLHSFGDFKRRGATRVGLGVDAENTTGAVRLYESVGMYPVRRTDIWHKDIA